MLRRDYVTGIWGSRPLQGLRKDCLKVSGPMGYRENCGLGEGVQFQGPLDACSTFVICCTCRARP